MSIYIDTRLSWSVWGNILKKKIKTTSTCGCSATPFILFFSFFFVCTIVLLRTWSTPYSSSTKPYLTTPNKTLPNHLWRGSQVCFTTMLQEYLKLEVRRIIQRIFSSLQTKWKSRKDIAINWPGQNYSLEQFTSWCSIAVWGAKLNYDRPQNYCCLLNTSTASPPQILIAHCTFTLSQDHKR